MRVGVFTFDEEGDVYIAEQPTKSTVMTPEQFRQKMEQILKSHDTAKRHFAADDLMCCLLSALGFEAGVVEFEEATKWYE